MDIDIEGDIIRLRKIFIIGVHLLINLSCISRFYSSIIVIISSSILIYLPFCPSKFGSFLFSPSFAR